MRQRFWISFGFWLLITPSIWACITPVFRYALENWPADLYEVTLVHRGPLSQQDRILLEKLQDASDTANILVETVDIAQKPDDETVKLWSIRSKPELPWMVVRYPQFLGIRDPVWTGRFTADAVEALLRSPLRSEIVRRIIEGDTAVWLLVESGVKERDEAAARLLETQLKRMERELEFSEEYRGYMLDVIGVDLKVKFSLVRVARTDPKERVLIRTLLHPILDGEGIRQPVTFPIFGRARSLCALIGDELNEESIEEICSFLVGGCSCLVKGANPGWDLLISADWDGMVDAQMEEIVFSGSATTVRDERARMSWRNLLIVLLLQLVAVATATYVVLWRRRKRRQ
jgi:hypothetical protein